MSNDKSPWLPASEITGESRYVFVPNLDVLDTAKSVYWRKGSGFEKYMEPSCKIKPEAYMEIPPRYVPEPQPKWDWQDNTFSPAQRVEFEIGDNALHKYFWVCRLPDADWTTSHLHFDTEREAKLAAEAWWESLKELTK
jgi:hypothetical protein